MKASTVRLFMRSFNDLFFFIIKRVTSGVRHPVFRNMRWVTFIIHMLHLSGGKMPYIALAISLRFFSSELLAGKCLNRTAALVGL
jgi:hypothetical protein